MTTALAPVSPPRAPRSVVVSAWAVPIMVLGQFALFAVVPLALVVRGALRDGGPSGLRLPALLLAASWATPLAVWLLRPGGAESLSKDIHPVFVAGIVAASAVVLLALRSRRR